jgi:threonine/homoserine/homoserine lactone efflux protein
MDWNSLAQFSAATLLILITPGPIMVIIAHNTLRHGAMAGFSTAIGVVSRARPPVLDGLTIAFANPAALLFYAAFFPQFINPDHSISMQIALLSAMYVCMRLVSASACVLTVARLRLPVGCAQVGRFANLGCAAVYLSISVITVLRLM